MALDEPPTLRSKLSVSGSGQGVGGARLRRSKSMCVVELRSPRDRLGRTLIDEA